MFLKLENADGKLVWINFNNVAYMRDDGGKTAIIFASPNNERLVVYVKLSLDQIDLLLTGE